MRHSWIQPERLLLAFLAVIIIWKGGKALDAVWLLALLSGGIILLSRPVSPRSLPVFFQFSLAGLLLWTILSFIFSTTRNYGFDEVLQTASLTLLTVWAASRKQEDTGFTERFAKTVSLAGLLACGIGVAVYVFQPVSRFVGTFFDHRFHTDYWPNAWAEFLLLMWPLLLWVMFLANREKFSSSRRTMWIQSVVLGFVFSCFLLSYSRGSVIAFGGQFVLLVTLVAVFQGSTMHWKKTVPIFLITLLTAIVFFMSINAVRNQFHDVQSVVRKATFSSDEGSSSVTERKNFWMQSLELTSEKPLFGWGPYSFRFLQPHLQIGVLETSDHPHNVFLKYAAERGIPSVILLVIILVWSLYAGLRSAMRSTAKIPLELFLLISVAGVTAHNLIDYNLQFVGIALPFWLCIGLLVSRSSTDKSSLVLSRVVKILAITLLCVTVLEGAHLAMSSRARRAEVRGDLSSALSWYERTNASLFPRDAWLARGEMLLALNQLPKAEQALDRSLGYNEQDGRAWRLLGDIYLRWKKPQDALRAYEKAYVFARYNDIGISRGLMYLLRDQDAEELLMRRHEFDMLLNEFGLSIMQNTHFIALSQNVEELIALCDLLAETFPESASAYRQLARRVQIHATEERAKTASRPHGLLW